MGSATALGTPAAGVRALRRADPAFSRALPRCSPTTTTRSSPPTSTDEAPCPHARLRARARRADGRRASCTRCSSARRSPAPASATLMQAIPSCCRRRAATPHGPASGTRVQDRARRRRARRSPTCACSPGTLRTRDRVRCGGDEAKVTAHRRLRRRRRGRAPAAVRGGSDRARSAGLHGGADRRRHRRAAGGGRRRRGTSPRRRWRRSSSRAAPADRRALRVALAAARRAGPADRPAPGRRPPRDLACRSTARCRRRSSRPTLAEDFGVDVELPRDHDDLHRAGRRHGRGASSSSARTPTRSWPPSGCASSPRRPAPGSRSASRSSSARCRTRSSARSRRPCARRCGQGLHGWRVPDCAVDHDPLGLLGAAEPRARDVRQEHVEHRGRLPQPHAAGADGARCGGPARACTSRCTASGSSCPPTRSARCCPSLARLRAVPGGAGDERAVVRARGRDPGGAGPRAAAGGCPG